MFLRTGWLVTLFLMIGVPLRSCSSDLKLPAKNVSRGKLIGQGEGTSGLDRVLFDCICVLE